MVKHTKIRNTQMFRHTQIRNTQNESEDQAYADEQAHTDEQDDGQSSGNTCDTEGCDVKSEWYKFCYECHQKGTEQGFLFVLTATCRPYGGATARQKIRPKLKRQITTDLIADRSRDCQH